VINVRSKTNVGKKVKKKIKVASHVPRRPAGFFKAALTREDIAEINLFSRVIAKMNAAR